MARSKRGKKGNNMAQMGNSIPLPETKGGVKAGKSVTAAALGLDTFGGGIRGNFPTNFAAYRTTYGNGDISSMQCINDVPAYFRLLNENNGGMFYWPTTLKEKYDWYRFFCYYIDDDNQCQILLPNGVKKDIREINIGDEIIDGQGNVRRVKDKLERVCNDNFSIQFMVEGVPNFRTTLEHPFLVLKRDRVMADSINVKKHISFTPIWEKAENINVGDYMLCPEEYENMPTGRFCCKYYLHEILKADKVQGGGTVYNIGIDSDNYDEQSYIANGVVSHNCRKDPIVKRAVEFHTDLPMSKLILRMPKMEDKEKSRMIQKRYENMVKEIKLFDRLHSILFELNVLGNCFCFNDFDEKRKQWSKIVILPPEEVNIAQYPMSDNSRVEYRPEQLKKILSENQPSIMDEESYKKSIAMLPSDKRRVLEGVPYDVARQLMSDDECIVMDTDPYNGEGDHKVGSFVYHFAEKRHPYYDLGVSPLECILEPLLMKEFLKNTNLSLASRNMTPRNKITAPNITREQLEELREQIDMSSLNPDYSVVTNYEWAWEQIGANDRLIDTGKEYEELDEQYYAGLGLTKEMITGEGLHSGSKINVELLNTRYMFKRELLIDFVENSLFEPMAEENGWYETDDYGNKTYFYPHLSFSRLSIRDNAEVFDSLFQLYQKGSLPIDIILELFNLDSDEILEKLKQDQFTPKDAVHNDMVRAIYSEIASQIAQNTNLADLVIKNMSGPNGEKLQKVEQPQDDYMASGEVPELPPELQNTPRPPVEQSVVQSPAPDLNVPVETPVEDKVVPQEETQGDFNDVSELEADETQEGN